jgi:hypothetical protein
MPLILRQEKGSKLSILEMDGNLEYLEGLTTQLGWERYSDATNTEFNKQSLTALVDNIITIDGANTILSQRPQLDPVSPMFSANKIRSIANGDTYDIRIDFKASISNVDGYFELFLDINGLVGAINTSNYRFPKGANTTQLFSILLKVYALDTFLLNGANILITPSHTMLIWDKSVFIERTYAAR